jgi:hypothetical protein
MGLFSGYGIGGGAYASFFSITVGTSQTALASTTPVYTCQGQISTDAAKDDSGVPTFSLEQIQMDSAFYTFVKTYGGTVTGVTAEDITLEDGVVKQGAAATGTNIAMGVKGPKIVGGSDDGKYWAYYGVVSVAKNSGSVNFAGGTYGKPNLVLVAQKLEKDLVIPSTVAANFQTGSGTTVTVAVTTDPYGKVDFA